MREEAAVLATAKKEAAERRRKGKSVATPSESEKSNPTSLGVVIREAETHSAQPTQEEDQYVGAFEWVNVDVDQSLLEDMVQFDDLKMQRSCAGRVFESKPVKSGKKIHLRSLRELGVKKQFLDYFRGMGFGWILGHVPCRVPVNLAKEFFNSFRFETTTDLDKEPIYFRFFNQEMAMSLKEWSLRLGLLSAVMNERGDWSQREIGQPSGRKEFNAEEAWKMIRMDGAKPFNTSKSKREEITKPVLQMAHIFSGQ